jgi:hypothetical protein
MSGFESFVELSKALSIAAIPVVLAVGGWVLQREVQQQSLRKEYVALALSILREPDSEKVGPELRAWAVELLNLNSDVKFDERIAKRLKSGETSLPSGFVGTSLTPAREQELARFQRFLHEVGFNVAPGRIGYDIWPGEYVDVGGLKYSALYDPEANTIRIARKYANDPDVAFHELMRRVLTRNDDTQSFALEALNSGLAVYFPCSFGEHAVYAETTDLKIDLRQNSRLNVPAPNDGESSYQVGSNNWAATFWAIRQSIKASSSDKLLARVWQHWQPPALERDVFSAFGRALVEAEPEHAETIRGILKQRGLTVDAPVKK